MRDSQIIFLIAGMFAAQGKWREANRGVILAAIFITLEALGLPV